MGIFKTSFDSSSEVNDFGPVVVYATLAALGVAVVFALLYLAMIRTCAKALIWASLIFALGCSVAYLVYMIILGSMGGMIFGAIMVALQVCWMYCVRPRIALAAAHLD